MAPAAAPTPPPSCILTDPAVADSDETHPREKTVVADPDPAPNPPAPERNEPHAARIRADAPGDNTPGDASLDASLSGPVPPLNESMALVRNAQGGDGEALNQLLARYQDRLRRIVRIKLGTHLRGQFDSMDIVQNTNLVAFQKIGDLELQSTAGLIHWLSRIAINQIRDANDYVHAQKRDPRREIRLNDREESTASSDHGYQLPDKARTPAERAAGQELEGIVDDAVAGLREDYRDVILLRDYYGGSWSYVTEQLGRDTVDGTRRLYERACLALSRELKPYL